VLEFPLASELSNGERDLLTFVGLIYKLRLKLKNKKAIIIIDEIFDYLDDSNILFAQYFLTKLIDECEENGIDLYIVLLTHLDPVFFRSYAFGKMSVYYLEPYNKLIVNNDLMQILINREEKSIDNNMSLFFLHYKIWVVI
jgi:wobble nucleotide-excising tRNase